ncbi:helix-turn-helix transcriptional regulator [Streptomyces sp. TLI_146]|uniref:helix-turn-helix domain-containing protein n=1 Tax=Streptomyces sp. TLI_146 TaxID=1938858 RepID=UPI0015D5900D|nr:helix-turn-helix transcriptional regulator [Streptomyces sp. TLI_146]
MPQNIFPLAGMGRALGHPSALKIIAGGKLRQLREACALTPKQVAGRLGFSIPKINKIEHGNLGCNPDDARAFLALYRVHEPRHVEQFLELLEQSQRPEYWKPWRTTVKDFFAPLLALEGAAQRIRIYEPFYVPGLLQTADYAAAVIRAEWPDRPEGEVQKTVELRMARQAQFAAQRELGDAPDLWMAVHEGVFAHSVEDREVLRAQIERVIERAERGEVAIQVAAPQMMVKAPLASNVTYLRFGLADLPDAVYVEQLASADFHQDPEQVEEYLVRLDRLATQIRTPDESVAWLKQQRDRL